MRAFLVCLAVVCSSALAEEPAYRDPGFKSVVQVAIVCRDIDVAAQRWAALLGVPVPKITLTKPGREVRMSFRGQPSDGQAKLAFFRTGQVVVELIEPVGAGTSWKQFLDERGEGVQHIAFQVTDLDKTVEAMRQSGFPVLHRGRYDSDTGSYVYVDSARQLGVTLELLHSDPKPRN